MHFRLARVRGRAGHRAPGTQLACDGVDLRALVLPVTIDIGTGTTDVEFGCRERLAYSGVLTTGRRRSIDRGPSSSSTDLGHYLCGGVCCGVRAEVTLATSCGRSTRPIVIGAAALRATKRRLENDARSTNRGLFSPSLSARSTHRNRRSVAKKTRCSSGGRGAVFLRRASSTTGVGVLVRSATCTTRCDDSQHPYGGTLALLTRCCLS